MLSHIPVTLVGAIFAQLRTEIIAKYRSTPILGRLTIIEIGLLLILIGCAVQKHPTAEIVLMIIGISLVIIGTILQY